MESDDGIRKLLADGLLSVSPLADNSIRPCSLLLHLGSELLLFEDSKTIVDPLLPNDAAPYEKVTLTDKPGFVLPSGGFALGATLESLALSTSVFGTTSGISGLARIGLWSTLSNHVSPGFGERNPRPLTVELKNMAPFPIRLHLGMRICHLLVGLLSAPASKGYDSRFPGKYMNIGATPSEYWREEI